MSVVRADATQRLSGGGRVVVWIVGIIASLNLIFLAIERSTGSAPAGPPSSSYATAPAGIAAYAELLERAGHPVTRLRTPPSEAPIDPSATVVALDANRMTPDDARALRRFVVAGGRLVTGGFDPRYVESIVDDPPRWAPAAAGEVRTIVPVPETGGVREVRTSGPGAWTDEGPALPVLRGDEGSALVVAAVGQGRVALLSTSSPLQNALLDDADNAALGLALAGPPGSPVVFVETVHGFGEAVGVGAIPAKWRWAALGAALAALVWLLSRGRRLGPPEGDPTEPAPSRRTYVDAMAATLGRTRDAPASVAPVRRAALERLARRTALRAGASEAEIRTAAQRLGLTDPETDALLRPPASDDDVVAAGRALAVVAAGRALTTGERR